MRINWRHCRLGDLGEIRSGGTPATNKNEYWGGPIPWCTPTDITSLKGRFISSTERQITELGVKNSNAELLPPGSVIVCTRATIGEAAINTVPMATNQGFKSIIPTQDVDSDFLYYLVRSLKREFVRRAAGSTFLEISASSFAKIPVRIPDSLEVQRWLVRPLILLDDIAIALQDLIATKREFKRGLMQELLTGRRRFPEFASEPWQFRRIGDIAEINPPTEIPLADDDPISFVPMASVTEGGGGDGSQIKRFGDVANGYTKFQERDVLVAKITPCFENYKGWLAEGLANGYGAGSTEFHVIRSSPDVLPEWIYLYTLSYDFRTRGTAAMTGSAGQQRVPADFIRRYKIPVPSTSEQETIVRIFKKVDLEIGLLQLLREQVETQRRGLMQKLLTGELTVPVSSEPEPIHV